MKYIFILLFSTSLFAETITISVPGMVCQMCVHGITKNMSKITGKDSVVVNMDKQIVVITTDEKVPDKKLTEIIKDAGYNAKSITREK